MLPLLPYPIWVLNLAGVPGRSTVNHFSRAFLCLLIGSLISTTALAHPRSCGVRAFGCRRACFSRGWGCFRGPAPCRFVGRSCGYRSYGRSWGFGAGYSPVYYGGYGGYFGGYPGCYAAPAVPVERNEPVREIEIAQWPDEELRRLALDKFSGTRDLDPAENRIGIEIVAKEYDDDTGALIKAKFRVHWVEWRTIRLKDGCEVREEKQKKTTVKLKFDELGRFTEFCD